MISQSSLRFYRYLDRAPWLRSYRRKFLFVAFVGTHIPLLTLIAYLVQATGSVTPVTVLWIALCATLAGTFVVLWALRLLLQPILLAGRALNSYMTTGEILALPADLNDEAGGMMRDVNSAIRLFAEQQQRLEESAETDFLTGLLNRRGADERLRQNFVEQNETGKPLYVALMDIDHFKSLNDNWGHGLGDAALKNMGSYLQQEFSQTEGWAARWGGEEFLLVRQGEGPGTESIEEVKEALDRLRRNLPHLYTSKNETMPLTASVGITEAIPGDSIEVALARADAALYTAKQNGRNQTRALK